MDSPGAIPADELAITVVSTGNPVRVVAVGAIDHASVARLALALTRAVHDAGAEVIVDLDAVTFIDSHGLQLLNDTHRMATETGTRLRIVATSRAVVRPLEAIGLWQV
ncbi:STAS domain-containing protein [Blastococcus sp. PRF04-17]|uniref:STAS domain-containing protein n=1 Tax=Blastococcus sp. PRF04-17 TaxID=2933797 RepID=UPI001FF353E2|nr:STAS domain-containing protein [Blastococcus sp. PRF04-17]UOY00288.1 STAS domain-containing protein [Blastococcus sp. PRF04-17]